MDEIFDSKELYKKVDTLRKERHWTIYEMAKRAGITENAIYSWRDKETTPSVYLLTSLCTAFDIHFVNLFINSDEDLVVLTKTQKELIGSWSLLKQEEKEAVLQIIKLYTEKK